MPYSAASAQSCYALFPSTQPTASQAFSIFTFSHSPRETHVMFEDFGNVLRSSNRDDAEFRVVGRKSLRRVSSTPSFKDSLRKMFGL